MVDLDRYREPSREPAVLEARRLALVDQLGWLADEAAALGPLLADLPAWAVDQAPVPEERTVKETLQALAALDRDVYPGWLDQIEASGASPEAPTFAVPDLSALGEGANERDLHELLADVRAQRQPLAARVAEIAPEVWDRPLTLGDETMDLYGLALDIVRRDADELKTLAYRLHSADISQRTRG
ncbi:hypothetical protein [Rubricoccus marinus]|uniref:DinB-like domain-containing protein n=1 Tax=Rubricoccus marinus TaxID=716817 RepID=A0A259U2Y5_9BACT|nr:hypothetical protein [Rubricoccus marinus]OZC04395.1 hypothetical protein BSZ36_16250 [Rubricoccus marinus]